MKTREVKVYRVLAERTCDTVDMDGCPTWENEKFYEEYFAEKKDAIATAQSKFAKQPLNTEIRDVYVVVYLVKVSNGRTQEEIYSKFKKK